ncbi:MAG: ribosome maturation factor RimP [Bacilli bacterium]|nr:ribosome maturation factor RimP [Bacilli bacterium]
MKINMNRIKEIANFCAEKIDAQIISVEFVREFGMKILRVIARKDPAFSIDDSSELNKLIGDELDKEDLIEEEYYLEVSSEGIEKELRNDAQIKQEIGKYVCVRLYEKLNGKKEISGDLVDFSNDEVVLEIVDKTKKEIIKINKQKIAKIRLAVKF